MEDRIFSGVGQAVKGFSGLEVRPYCQTADMPRVRIDRLRVIAYKTVFGEVEYSLMGRMGRVGEEWPMARPEKDFAPAWAQKERMEKQIEQARREEAERASKRDIPPPARAV